VKALGVKVPATLLASTDEVVDSTLFPAVRKSGFGTKRTYREVCYLSAFGGKADI
jgi:hypothetical protein